MASSSIRNLIFFTGFVGAMSVLTPSCADNNQSIFVRQMQSLDPLVLCQVKNDPTALSISAGILDVAVGSTYIGYPLVGNQLISRGDPKTSRAESMRVQIQGAEVHVIDLASGNDLAPGVFSVLATGIADPTLSADPGYGVAAIQLISPAVVTRNDLVSRARKGPVSLVAAFKVYGKTLGGTDVTAGEFQFPITVCYGCLIDFTGTVADPAITTPNCKAAIKTGDVVKFCTAGQDLPYDCRYCQGLNACALCATPADCPQAGGLCVSNHCTTP